MTVRYSERMTDEPKGEVAEFEVRFNLSVIPGINPDRWAARGHVAAERPGLHPVPREERAGLYLRWRVTRDLASGGMKVVL